MSEALKPELPSDENKADVESKEKIKLEWGSEAPEKMGWINAKQWCDSLGEGWRLPTSEELKATFESKTEGFIVGNHYWTSYFYGNSSSWFGYKENGEIDCDYTSRDNKNSVRLVKNIN
jgi:hypothetical protein